LKRIAKKAPVVAKDYNNKQMGDAAEMLIAAELTLHGRPAFIVPANWPGYDVVAQPPNLSPQRVSVKSRDRTTFFDFDPDTFDWLAVVIIRQTQRRFFLIPKDVAVAHSYPRDFPSRKGGPRGIHVRTVLQELVAYENNFELRN
jgi:hypothetical protein